MAFVMQMDHLTQGELRDLLRIQAFFRSGREATWLTERERSLELFGDEKRLEQLSAGRLFGPGRLALEALRCEAIHPPFVFREFVAATKALLIENKDTFHSACKAADALAGQSSVRWVGIKGWRTVPSEVQYLGDVDLDGLEIAIGLTELASRWTPSLGVRCAGGWLRPRPLVRWSGGCPS